MDSSICKHIYLPRWSSCEHRYIMWCRGDILICCVKCRKKKLSSKKSQPFLCCRNFSNRRKWKTNDRCLRKYANKREIRLIKTAIKQKYASIIRSPVLTIFRFADYGTPGFPYRISFSIKFPVASWRASLVFIEKLFNYKVLKQIGNHTVRLGGDEFWG